MAGMVTGAGIAQGLGSKGAGAKSAAQASGKESSVNLFDHMSSKQSPEAMLNAMPPEMQAKVLANPASLGKKMFGYLDGFQQRSQTMMSGGYMQGGKAASGAAGGQMLPGPAERHPGATNVNAADSSWDRAEGFLQTFREMYTFLAETQLVTAGTTQSSRSVTTLLRSQ